MSTLGGSRSAEELPIAPTFATHGSSSVRRTHILSPPDALSCSKGRRLTTFVARRLGGSVSLAEHAFAVYSIGGYSNEILLGASALLAVCTNKYLAELNGEHISAGETMRLAYEKDDKAAARLAFAQQRAREVSRQIDHACEAEARAGLAEAEAVRAARTCPDELLLKAATTHTAAIEARAARVAAAIAVDELVPVLASARAEVKVAEAEATISAAELREARDDFEVQALKVQKWVET